MSARRLMLLALSAREIFAPTSCSCCRVEASAWSSDMIDDRTHKCPCTEVCTIAAMRKLCVLVLLSLSAHAGGPIVDTAKSPHAVFHSVPITSVKMGGGFWEDRRKINVER